MPDNKKPSSLVLLVVLVAVVLLGGGYFMMNKGGKVPALPGVGGLGLNSNCKYNDPDLCKFLNKMMTGDFMKNGFSGNTTMTDKSGKKTLSRIESQGEKMQMVTSVDSKETFNFIKIGDTTYMKDYSDGKWLKQVTPKVETTPGASQNFQQAGVEEFKNMFKEQEDKTTYKKIGKEACGSYNCFKYQIVNSDRTDTTEYIFFDDNAYMMRKTQSVTKDGTTTEFEFDYGPVNITEPSPVKSLPSVPAGTESTGTGTNQEELQKLMEQYQQNPPVEEPNP